MSFLSGQMYFQDTQLLLRQLSSDQISCKRAARGNRFQLSGATVQAARRTENINQIQRKLLTNSRKNYFLTRQRLKHFISVFAKLRLHGL